MPRSATAPGVRRRRRRRWPALLAAVALAGLFAGPAQADVLVFTGESLVDGTNWHDAINWRRYTQGAGGTLAVDIDGSAPATGHVQLAVSGTATLAGTLAIATGAGFEPPLDSTYDVVTASTVSGRFGSLTGARS